MALRTHSLFYYGHVINGDNNLINFKEGAGPEKIAEIPVGSYTLSKFLEVIVSSLNAESSLDWSYSLDRKTRIVTLTSSGTASLLFGTGSTFSSAPSELLGFPQIDILNATSFVGSFGSGSSFSPQFPLQDFKDKSENKKMINAVVSKSATGDSVSVQSFGTEQVYKMNIKYITNNPTEGILRFNSQAVEQAKDFLNYVVEKHPIEFMKDETTPEVFDKVYLQTTPQSQDGTAYELTEYVDRSLPEFFETGLLTFKLINLE